MFDAIIPMKERGEEHYKTGGIELVDLLHDMMPAPALTVGDISALTSIMRYATRMLLKGLNATDLKDIATYADMVAAIHEAKGDTL